MPFPNEFTWGVASAAFQIEGASNTHGRGACIWDDFCAEQGRVFDGHTGEVACDSYHRASEDVQLISELGANGYRFRSRGPDSSQTALVNQTKKGSRTTTT